LPVPPPAPPPQSLGHDHHQHPTCMSPGYIADYLPGQDRIMRATRDYNMGETIFTEEPVMVAPGCDFPHRNFFKKPWSELEKEMFLFVNEWRLEKVREIEEDKKEEAAQDNKSFGKKTSVLVDSHTTYCTNVFKNLHDSSVETFLLLKQFMQEGDEIHCEEDIRLPFERQRRTEDYLTDSESEDEAETTGKNMKNSSESENQNSTSKSKPPTTLHTRTFHQFLKRAKVRGMMFDSMNPESLGSAWGFIGFFAQFLKSILEQASVGEQEWLRKQPSCFPEAFSSGGEQCDSEMQMPVDQEQDAAMVDSAVEKKSGDAGGITTQEDALKDEKKEKVSSDNKTPAKNNDILIHPAARYIKYSRLSTDQTFSTAEKREFYQTTMKNEARRYAKEFCSYLFTHLDRLKNEFSDELEQTWLAQVEKVEKTRPCYNFDECDPRKNNCLMNYPEVYEIRKNNMSAAGGGTNPTAFVCPQDWDGFGQLQRFLEQKAENSTPLKLASRVKDYLLYKEMKDRIPFLSQEDLMGKYDGTRNANITPATGGPTTGASCSPQEDSGSAGTSSMTPKMMASEDSVSTTEACSGLQIGSEFCVASLVNEDPAYTGRVTLASGETVCEVDKTATAGDKRGSSNSCTSTTTMSAPHREKLLKKYSEFLKKAEKDLQLQTEDAVRKYAKSIMVFDPPGSTSSGCVDTSGSAPAEHTGTSTRAGDEPSSTPARVDASQALPGSGNKDSPVQEQQPEALVLPKIKTKNKKKKQELKLLQEKMLEQFEEEKNKTKKTSMEKKLLQILDDLNQILGLVLEDEDEEEAAFFKECAKDYQEHVDRVTSRMEQETKNFLAETRAVGQDLAAESAALQRNVLLGINPVPPDQNGNNHTVNDWLNPLKFASQLVTLQQFHKQRALDLRKKWYRSKEYEFEKTIRHSGGSTRIVSGSDGPVNKGKKFTRAHVHGLAALLSVWDLNAYDMVKDISTVNEEEEEEDADAEISHAGTATEGQRQADGTTSSTLPHLQQQNNTITPPKKKFHKAMNIRKHKIENLDNTDDPKYFKGLNLRKNFQDTYEIAVRLNEVDEENHNHDEKNQRGNRTSPGKMSSTSASASEDPPTSRRALFPEVALISHGCHPNVMIDTSEKNHAVVRAAKRINKGDVLYSCYATSTAQFLQLPLALRRRYLAHKRNFFCICDRCIYEERREKYEVYCGEVLKLKDKLLDTIVPPTLIKEEHRPEDGGQGFSVNGVLKPSLFQQENKKGGGEKNSCAISGGGGGQATAASSGSSSSSAAGGSSSTSTSASGSSSSSSGSSSSSSGSSSSASCSSGSSSSAACSSSFSGSSSSSSSSSSKLAQHETVQFPQAQDNTKKTWKQNTSEVGFTRFVQILNIDEVFNEPHLLKRNPNSHWFEHCWARQSGRDKDASKYLQFDPKTFGAKVENKMKYNNGKQLNYSQCHFKALQQMVGRECILPETKALIPIPDAVTEEIKQFRRVGDLWKLCFEYGLRAESVEQKLENFDKQLFEETLGSEYGFAWASIQMGLECENYRRFMDMNFQWALVEERERNKSLPKNQQSFELEKWMERHSWEDWYTLGASKAKSMSELFEVEFQAKLENANSSSSSSPASGSSGGAAVLAGGNSSTATASSKTSSSKTTSKSNTKASNLLRAAAAFEKASTARPPLADAIRFGHFHNIREPGQNDIRYLNPRNAPFGLGGGRGGGASTGTAASGMNILSALAQSGANFLASSVQSSSDSSERTNGGKNNCPVENKIFLQFDKCSDYLPLENDAWSLYETDRYLMLETKRCESKLFKFEMFQLELSQFPLSLSLEEYIAEIIKPNVLKRAFEEFKVKDLAKDGKNACLSALNNGKSKLEATVAAAKVVATNTAWNRINSSPSNLNTWDKKGLASSTWDRKLSEKEEKKVRDYAEKMFLEENFRQHFSLFSETQNAEESLLPNFSTAKVFDTVREDIKERGHVEHPVKRLSNDETSFLLAVIEFETQAKFVIEQLALHWTAMEHENSLFGGEQNEDEVADLRKSCSSSSGNYNYTSEFDPMLSLVQEQPHEKLCYYDRDLETELMRRALVVSSSGEDDLTEQQELLENEDSARVKDTTSMHFSLQNVKATLDDYTENLDKKTHKDYISSSTGQTTSQTASVIEVLEEEVSREELRQVYGGTNQDQHVSSKINTSSTTSFPATVKDKLQSIIRTNPNIEEFVYHLLAKDIAVLDKFNFDLCSLTPEKEKIRFTYQQILEILDRIEKSAQDLLNEKKFYRRKMMYSVHERKATVMQENIQLEARQNKLSAEKELEMARKATRKHEVEKSVALKYLNDLEIVEKKNCAWMFSFFADLKYKLLKEAWEEGELRKEIELKTVLEKKKVSRQEAEEIRMKQQREKEESDAAAAAAAAAAATASPAVPACSNRASPEDAARMPRNEDVENEDHKRLLPPRSPQDKDTSKGQLHLKKKTKTIDTRSLSMRDQHGNVLELFPEIDVKTGKEIWVSKVNDPTGQNVPKNLEEEQNSRLVIPGSVVEKIKAASKNSPGESARLMQQHLAKDRLEKMKANFRKHNEGILSEAQIQEELTIMTQWSAAQDLVDEAFVRMDATLRTPLMMYFAYLQDDRNFVILDCFDKTKLNRESVNYNPRKNRKNNHSCKLSKEDFEEATLIWQDLMDRLLEENPEAADVIYKRGNKKDKELVQQEQNEEHEHDNKPRAGGASGSRSAAVSSSTSTSVLPELPCAAPSTTATTTTPTSENLNQNASSSSTAASTSTSGSGGATSFWDKKKPLKKKQKQNPTEETTSSASNNSTLSMEVDQLQQHVADHQNQTDTTEIVTIEKKIPQIVFTRVRHDCMMQRQYQARTTLDTEQTFDGCAGVLYKHTAIFSTHDKIVENACVNLDFFRDWYVNEHYSWKAKNPVGASLAEKKAREYTILYKNVYLFHDALDKAHFVLNYCVTKQQEVYELLKDNKTLYDCTQPLKVVDPCFVVGTNATATGGEDLLEDPRRRGRNTRKTTASPSEQELQKEWLMKNFKLRSGLLLLKAMELLSLVDSKAFDKVEIVEDEEDDFDDDDHDMNAENYNDLARVKAQFQPEYEVLVNDYNNALAALSTAEKINDKDLYHTIVKSQFTIPQSQLFSETGASFETFSKMIDAKNAAAEKAAVASLTGSFPPNPKGGGNTTINGLSVDDLAKIARKAKDEKTLEHFERLGISKKHFDSDGDRYRENYVKLTGWVPLMKNSCLVKLKGIPGVEKVTKNEQHWVDFDNELDSFGSLFRELV
ncbi:unnamed protein product, partial [Amoebophrya sp. A120]